MKRALLSAFAECPIARAARRGARCSAAPTAALRRAGEGVQKARNDNDATIATQLAAMQAEIDLSRAAALHPDLAQPGALEALEQEARFLRQRRAALRVQMAEEQRAARRAGRAALDVVRLAERPWAVLDTPVISTPFRLFAAAETHKHNERVAAFDAAPGGRGPRGGNAGRRPRCPSLPQLRAAWTALAWPQKRRFVLGATHNALLKRRMMGALLCGCHDFAALAREVEAQIVTGAALAQLERQEEDEEANEGDELLLRQQKKQQKKQRRRRNSNAASAAAPKDESEVALAWHAVEQLLRAGHGESSDSVVSAKMRLFTAMQRTKMHLYQNH